jgi:hypothetical protein
MTSIDSIAPTISKPTRTYRTLSTAGGATAWRLRGRRLGAQSNAEGAKHLSLP